MIFDGWRFCHSAVFRSTKTLFQQPRPNDKRHDHCVGQRVNVFSFCYAGLWPFVFRGVTVSAEDRVPQAEGCGEILVEMSGLNRVMNAVSLWASEYSAERSEANAGVQMDEIVGRLRHNKDRGECRGGKSKQKLSAHRCDEVHALPKATVKSAPVDAASNKRNRQSVQWQGRSRAQREETRYA
jgi:hypothetical protein